MKEEEGVVTQHGTSAYSKSQEYHWSKCGPVGRSWGLSEATPSEGAAPGNPPRDPDPLKENRGSEPMSRDSEDGAGCG